MLSLCLQPGWRLLWWPRVSSRPGHDVAAALLRLVARQRSAAACCPAAADSLAAAQAQQQQQQQAWGDMDNQDLQAPAVAAAEALPLPATAVAAPAPAAAAGDAVAGLEAPGGMTSNAAAAAGLNTKASPARAHVVFDALMGMPEADVQLASRLASAVVAVSSVTSAAPSAVPAAVPAAGGAALEQMPSAASTVAGMARPPAADAAEQATKGRQDAAGTGFNAADADAEDGSGASCAGVPAATTAQVPIYAAHQQQQHQQATQQQQQQQRVQAGSGVLPADVLGVEHHARPQHDYYATNALLDFLAFTYLALFYQVNPVAFGLC